MINLSEIVLNPAFAQPFQIKRLSGTFANEGEFTETNTTIDRYGVIQPAKPDDVLKFLPEGERQGNAIMVHCADEVRMGDGVGLRSDIILWHGEQYRVAFAKPWQDYGYWFVIAVGMAT